MTIVEALEQLPKTMRIRVHYEMGTVIRTVEEELVIARARNEAGEVTLGDGKFNYGKTVLKEIYCDGGTLYREERPAPAAKKFRCQLCGGVFEGTDRHVVTPHKDPRAAKKRCRASAKEMLEVTES